MAFDGLRGYAQAASDLSGIARARLADVVGDLVRSEVERVGGIIGLATAEELADLRRTVERLQGRVAALEDTSRGGVPPAGVEAPARPGRRPSAARNRSAAVEPATESVTQSATQPTRPAESADPETPATPAVTPVRRPRAVADAARRAQQADAQQADPRAASPVPTPPTPVPTPPTPVPTPDTSLGTDEGSAL